MARRAGVRQGDDAAADARLLRGLAHAHLARAGALLYYIISYYIILYYIILYYNSVAGSGACASCTRR